MGISALKDTTQVIYVMSYLFSTIATWGPAAYHAMETIRTAALPPILATRLIHQNEHSSLALDQFPDIFAKENQVRRDIVVYYVHNLPYAVGSLGANIGSCAMILANKELFTLDSNACNYLCKHELSHIKGNDGLIVSSLAALASTISAFTVPYLNSFLPYWLAPFAYCIPLLAGSSTYHFTYQRLENKADLFACHHASDEELISGLRFIKSQMETYKTLQAKYPHFFSAQGAARLGGYLAHNSHSIRLDQILEECHKRNLPIETDLLDNSQIKEFHQNIFKKFWKLSSD